MVSVLIVCSILILRLTLLPPFNGPTSFDALAPLTPFLAVTVWRLLEPGETRIAERGRPARGILVSALLVMTVVAGWRAIGPTTGFTSHLWRIATLNYMVIAAFGYVVFVRDRDKSRVHRALTALCFAPSAYVAGNVLLRALGVSPVLPAVAQTQERAEVLGYFGIHHFRTFFPLSDGVNSFGIIVGVAASMTMVIAIASKGRLRRWAVAAVAIDVYAILLTDSRGAMAAAVGAALLSILIRTPVTRRAVRNLGFLVPASPLIAAGVLSLLTAPSVTADATGRTLATGTNRLFIWKPVLQMLSHFRLDDIFGYGSFGQLGSGVSQTYAYLFGDVAFTPGVHNLVLQTILDTGYVGLVVAAAIYVLYMRAFADAAHQGSLVASVLLAALVYFLLIGITEAAPTTYTPDDFYYFILVLFAGITLTGFQLGDETERRSSGIASPNESPG